MIFTTLVEVNYVLGAFYPSVKICLLEKEQSLYIVDCEFQVVDTVFARLDGWLALTSVYLLQHTIAVAQARTGCERCFITTGHE